MVLGTAQYKRQSNDATEEEEEVASFDSENLNQTEDLTPGSGHVQFVDSSIRYHLPTPRASWYSWRARTPLEKGLIFLIFSVLVLLILASIIEEHKKPNQADNGNIHVTAHKVCFNPECVKAAGNILSDANFGVDPCDDFYSYACGGWEKANPLPDGKAAWNMFEKIWEKNELILKNAFEEEERHFDPNEQIGVNATKKTLAYYLSCLDSNGTIEELRGKPLLDLISKTKLETWNLFAENPKPFISNKDDFQNILEDLEFNFQASGFFSWGVVDDSKNASRHILQIDQGGLSLPTRDYYLNTTEKAENKQVVKAFKQMIVDVAKLMIKEKEGIDHIQKSRALKIWNQVEKILELETRLANFTVPSSQRQDEKTLYHNMTLNSFQEMAPFLNWTVFFKNAFKQVGIDVNGDQEVVVLAPTYMKNLSNLLLEYMNTVDQRIAIENYMIMQLVKGFRGSLSKVYRDVGKGLEIALYGKENHIERWRTCVSSTDSVLGFASGSLFIKSSFIGKSKDLAREMISGIKKAFVSRIKNISWMDEETKRMAVKKANAIKDYIGYPDYILIPNELNEKYRKLEVKFGEHFNNTLRHRVFFQRENLEKLSKPVNKTKWSMTPPSVNAYYTPTKNEIVFPAGILQNPFFNMQYPKSLNFGAIGVVMGHELSHGFDNSGREYNEKGNMERWWNNKTEAEFNKRAKCMEEQYSSYHFGNQSVNGNQTLGENIADNGGLKTAYKAYMNWLESNQIEQEDPLPGINMTHHQLFFMSFSQVWCSVSTPQSRMLQLREDVHSPAKFRVLGVLSNSEEFAKAFDCPKNSPMNPDKKCEIW